MRSQHPAPDFAHPQCEYEADCIRTASSPAAAVAGLCIIALFAAGTCAWILLRRSGPFAGLLLALVAASCLMGCAAHKPQDNPRPRAVGMEREVYQPRTR